MTSPTRLPRSRDAGRPVRRRTRTFRPNYLSFAGTYQCNLDCPHCCVPIEWTDRLDIPTALRFLEEAHAYGIDLLGFTGGEPFVYPDFVRVLCRRAAVDWSDVLHRYLLVSPDVTMTVNWNHLAPVERAERFTGAWDGVWFKEDYCEGPGQALIVNPKGEVKPCCGFASDLDQLTIGNIHTDTAADIIENGRNHPYVGKVFRDGLTAIRDEILARDPAALPGVTSNHCYFCWYVLTRGLASGVGGGGGQVGGWTGPRANYAGELLQLGLPKAGAAR